MLPLGKGLTFEHVRVAATLTIIGGERISGPHGLKAWIFLELGARYDRARIGVRGRVWQASLPPYLVRCISTVRL